jgi:hypothetical protein
MTLLSYMTYYRHCVPQVAGATAALHNAAAHMLVCMNLEPSHTFFAEQVRQYPRFMDRSLSLANTQAYFG